jgi:competence protein ComEC
MFQKYPLLRVIIPFIIGVACFITFHDQFDRAIFGIISICLLATTIISWNWVSFKYRIIRGIFLQLSIFFIAFTYTGIYQENAFSLPSNIANDTTTYIAKIVDPPVEKQRSIKLTLLISQYKNGEKLITTNEKCLIYVYKDSLSQALEYGDEIMFRTQLKAVPSPLNPDEFNYQKSLWNKGIRFQSYLEGYSWQKIGSDKGNFIMSMAFQLRNKFLKILTEYKMDNTDYGVAAAILLGYDEKLDPELSSHYSGAGVTHVLCVSGMHVGVVYMILNFFLVFLDKKQSTKILKAILLLGFVWLYSAITGLSPSVLRSAAMFSFIIIGSSLKQKVNTYHSLMASLLFLILLDPFVIFNLGLQLSYFAVFGIVWLQRPIHNLWIPKYKWVDSVWQLITVSLAAQILTTPISIFYFHQFPNYFILSNLLIVFVSTLVIYLGVAVLVVSFWHWLSNLIAYIMIWMIKLMNFLTISISDLPGAQTANIDLGFYSMIVLYLFILFTCVMLVSRNKNLIWSSIGFAIIFISMLIFDNFQEMKTNQMVIYSLNKRTIIDIKSSNKMITLCDSATYVNKEYLNYQVKTHRVAQGVVPDSVLMLTNQMLFNRDAIHIQNHFAQIGNKRIAFVNGLIYADSLNPINVDYALVYGNPKLKMGYAYRGIKAKTWVFDASNSSYKVQKWQHECDSLHLKSYSIASEGALILDF